MIQQLSVQNYILIKTLQFDFKPSMMVVTGETGAGKSIFIHALSLIMGQRLNREIVGPYDSKAIIEAVFTFTPDSNAYHQLVEAGFEVEDEMVFSRIINDNGKSSYRINRELVPLNLVKSILIEEIDIHSQFNTQGLLDEKNHLNYLDQLIDHGSLIDDVKQKYGQYKDLIHQKNQFLAHQLDEFELNQLKNEIDLLEKLNFSGEEIDSIQQELKRMKEVESSLASAYELSDIFDEVNYESLYPVLNSSPNNEINDLVSSAYYQLSEAHQSIKHAISSADFDEDTYQQLNERAYLYSSTMRRLNRSVEEIINYIDESKELIANHSDHQKTLQQFDKKIEEAHQTYWLVANKLSELRKAMSIKLSKELEAHSHDLNLHHFKFNVEFSEIENEHGIDQVRFLIALNKGQALAPLSQVASGGELSRVMLALKVIFNRHQTPKLIVFDEIDSGVSGQVAQLMGQKMAKLSQEHALLVVTHLPIIAAFGDSHHLVYKKDVEKFTEVYFKELNFDERIEQLALMLSSQINETSLEAATNLFSQTKDLKNES